MEREYDRMTRRVSKERLVGRWSGGGLVVLIGLAEDQAQRAPSCINPLYWLSAGLSQRPASMRGCFYTGVRSAGTV